MSGTYRARFTTSIELTVDIDAEDEDTAADMAWEQANLYLHTLIGDGNGLTADADLDGIGADEVTPTPPPESSDA